MLVPFTTHYVGFVDDMCDGCIGSSMTFQESLTKILQMEMMNDNNDTSMMNVDANMDDLKD
jgi:hypothetical protein